MPELALQAQITNSDDDVILMKLMNDRINALTTTPVQFYEPKTEMQIAKVV